MSRARSVFSASVSTLALMSLISCTSYFVTRPEGRLGHQVTFTFYQSKTATTPSKRSIVNFLVQEELAETEWTTVWELKGAESLSVISYGTRYQGLKEQVSPRALSQRALYRAVAIDRAPLGEGSYSSVYFFFNQDGEIVEGRRPQTK